MKLSVIVPVYNEVNTVLDVIEKIESVCIDKEIIIVNDCSTDGTKEKLDTLAGKDHIKILHYKTKDTPLKIFSVE